jgi:methylmalonyl-CoA mutase
MAAALTSGYLQDAIDEVAEKCRRDIATGRIELTGVSAFPRLGDDGITTDPWPAGQPRSSAPSVTIKQLKQARLAAPFERLRDAADAHTASSGTRPQVFLVCLGNLADYNARANWMRNILASGGIDVIAGHEFSRSGDAGAVFADNGARVACIVSSDAVYAELAEATAHALKSAGAEHVMLAGRPGDLEAELKEAGVDTFWYAGMDRVAALTALQSVFGIETTA